MNESLILVADDSQEICRFIEENVLVPAGPGMAPAEQGVPPAAPMAPREVPEGYVSQADMEARDQNG